eukprot:TRINITY_DN1131_c0_g2_i2.p1 TRINITY_DN1131_c0_g2~~TRINITY_DN1131_c0_g2_i2.p1  ORF type:complete len:1050 (+),score=220.95 TRINITY_DN1131_c0_g2_i2:342-3491(+)
MNPPNTHTNTHTKSITNIDFMNTDIHYNNQSPWSDVTRAAATMHGYPLKTIPVVYIHGLTGEGISVTAMVCGVFPYFYVSLPSTCEGSVDSGVLCDAMRDALNESVQSIKGIDEQIVLSVEMIESRSVWGYTVDAGDFFKVTLSSPRFMVTARNVLEKEGLEVSHIGGRLKYKTYEANVDFILRCMIDIGINGVSWLRLVDGGYNLISGSDKRTYSQIEVEAIYNAAQPNIVSLPDVDQCMNAAPLRILSFNMQCSSKKGAPNPEYDSVYQIANVVNIIGENEPITQNIFVLGTCTDTVDTDIHCYETEAELLKAWQSFVMDVDPDVLTGYDIVNSEIPFLFDRAMNLGLDDFRYMTRIREKNTVIRKSTFSVGSTGQRENTVIQMCGRVMFDLLQVVKLDFKLSSYTLNNLSSHFLNQKKEYLTRSIISQLHEGSPDERLRLALYGLNNALLPQRLLIELMSLTNYIEMSRVSGVPFSFLVERGQTVKVLSQIYRKTRAKNMLIPTSVEWSPRSFEGARVMVTDPSFFDCPIVTLHFRSLYPSIMIAHNLCYTTLITKTQAEVMCSDDYTQTPNGNYFVKEHKMKGILPEILEDLLKQRTEANAQMGIEEDAIKKKVLNARQLALKVICNSIYGFTGTTQFHCPEISSSVTAYGRQMIDQAQEAIKLEYSIENGYPKDAEIIYVDTDSLMVDFGVNNIFDAVKMGKEAGELASQAFLSPVRVEFEKVYHPFLIVSKQRYAGMVFTSETTKGYIEMKGIQTARRDTSDLVRYTITTCLEILLRPNTESKENIKDATEFVQSVISDLLNNRVDISLLVITNSLNKEPEEYTTQQPHSALTTRMRERSTGPIVGDPVPYVIVCIGDDNTPIYEKSEDPMYAIMNDIPIDTRYYLEKLTGPLERIFKVFFKNPNALFTQGKHTTHIKKATKPKKGSIKRFFPEKKSCLLCKGTITNDKVLCVSCEPNASEIYQTYLDRYTVKERDLSRLYEHCQTCQGSDILEIFCESKDCPIFYNRLVAEQELELAQSNERRVVTRGTFQKKRDVCSVKEQ